MDVDTKRGRFEVVDRGQGPLVVLVHGFPFAADSWSADADALASRMRIVAPSMRGFGGSSASDAELASLSIDAMADDVAAIIDALGLDDRVIVGGLSMGGYVALAFARKYPARLRALVLADTRAEPDSDEARANRDKAIARVESGDLAGFVEGLLETIVAPATRAERPDVVDEVRRMAMQSPPSSVIAALRALRDRPDARPGLVAIAVPVLVVVGEHDAVTPPAVSRAMASAIGDARASVHVVPRAGHLSNLEQPEEFRAALSAFVANGA
jgi:3-oxoadipate enol-lactonase